MRYLIGVLCLGFWGTSAMAQNLSSEACERLLAAAETKPDPVIYDDCGFNDENRAWNEWAPWAAAHDMKHAVFELCKRYPNHTYGPIYCEKAIKLNFGPALAYMGEKRLSAGKNKEALDYFNRAVKSGDLTENERVSIMEKLGTLYLTKEAEEYAPDAGIALLTRAANKRSAMANNALAYLIYSGEHRIKKDPQKALSFLWRSILLGCKAAEENLGAYHLARQGRIPVNEAVYYMSLQAFTCDPFDKEDTDDSAVLGCDCAKILEQDAFFKKQPYLYLDLRADDKIVLQTPAGDVLSVDKTDILPDSVIIQEVKPTLLTLIQNGKKIFVNRYHTGNCVNQCLKYAANPPKKKPIAIRPYHLTFTEQECATIDYYAKKLVDTTLPYVGKEECHTGAGMDETTKLLLK